MLQKRIYDRNLNGIWNQAINSLGYKESDQKPINLRHKNFTIIKNKNLIVHGCQ